MSRYTQRERERERERENIYLKSKCTFRDTFF
jgi:hypothetical protein